jgi:hypothetical protein
MFELIMEVCHWGERQDPFHSHVEQAQLGAQARENHDERRKASSNSSFPNHLKPKVQDDVEQRIGMQG